MNDFDLYSVGKQRVQEYHQQADLVRLAQESRPAKSGIQETTLKWLGEHMVQVGQQLQCKANPQLCFESDEVDFSP